MRADPRQALAAVVVLLVAAVAAWGAVGPKPSVSVEVSTLGGAPSPPHLPGPSASAGLVGLRLGAHRVSFGALDPGQASEPVRLDVSNTGIVPLALRVEASPLAGPFAAIPASQMVVSTMPGGGGSPLTVGGVQLDRPLAPGESAQLWFTLHVPGGAAGHLPADAYHGTLRVTGVGA